MARGLLAAFDVRTGHVLGECKPQRRAENLVAFMENLALVYPKGQVYVVWEHSRLLIDAHDVRVLGRVQIEVADAGDFGTKIWIRAVQPQLQPVRAKIFVAQNSTDLGATQ